MHTLSHVLRFWVTDTAGQRARLVDLAVYPLDVDYPPVSQLIFRDSQRKLRGLPWAAGMRLDPADKTVAVPDLAQGALLETPPQEQAVWLGRDVLDAIIIDLQSRRVTRADELYLDEAGGRLELRAADTGVLAMAGRLGLGRRQVSAQAGPHDWKYLEFLRGDPKAVEAGAGYLGRIVRLPPGQIAHLTESLPYLHAAELILLLPDSLTADTLELMSPERQLQVFEELNDPRALRLLALMAPDVAADLLGRLALHETRRFLNRMPRAQAERVLELLRYPENTVGGLMTNDVVIVPAGLTIAQAREHLREPLKHPDFVYFIYVVENLDTRKLVGVFSLRDFVVAADDTPIASIMNPYLLTLSPLDAPHIAAHQLLSSQLAAMPVIGAEGQLLGALTVDVAVRLEAPRNWSAQAPRVFS
ncbi:MAG: CBS domain-containing protein [Anaerolineales bacterium]